MASSTNELGIEGTGTVVSISQSIGLPPESKSRPASCGMALSEYQFRKTSPWTYSPFSSSVMNRLGISAERLRPQESQIITAAARSIPRQVVQRLVEFNGYSPESILIEGVRRGPHFAMRGKFPIIASLAKDHRFHERPARSP